MHAFNSQSFEQNIAQFECRLINRVMRHANNNQTLAAQLMGISRRTLFSRLEIMSTHQHLSPVIRPRRNGIHPSMITIHPFDLWQWVDCYEKKLIQHSLELNHGNITQTAKMLGIPRSKLRDKKRKLKII